jgi:uncharacterized protein (TIGR01777 family)
VTQPRVVLAGGSGFLGQSLAAYLDRNGYAEDVLTRSLGDIVGHPVAWDARTIGPWAGVLDGAAAVVNLVGKSVNCRYTPENRREIVRSRVESVNAIKDAIAWSASPPKAWIQAASLAIYGNPGDAVCAEDAPHGTGFSVDVCEQWEAAFDQFAMAATRKVLLRIGIVLGKGGGALSTLMPLARIGLGGQSGNGRQYLSWLDIKDFNRMIYLAITHSGIEGVYNATGPAPTTNAEFMASLRRVVHRPWSPPVPQWAIQLGTWVMRTEPELVLDGRRCVPQRFHNQGFAFEIETLEESMKRAVSGQVSG